MIRRLLARSLGAPVNDWLRRQERVYETAHRRLARRWLHSSEALAGQLPAAKIPLERVRSAITLLLDGESPSVAAEQGAAPPATAAVGDAVLREDDPHALVLHLAALPRAMAVPDLAAQPSAAPPRWFALTEGELRPELTLALLADACLGSTPRPARARALDSLAHGLEPRRWFPREGAALGAANLLRAFVADGEGALAGYAAEVSERLLRHVEVQREHALHPRGSAARAATRLEQVRFTLALLDAAERWRDLRFLNAALKRTDLHHRQWARRRTGSGPALLAGLHYAAAVARQEALVRELAP